MTILDGMSSFVAVVESGSFTKAADQLGQTKSAVSKHVTKLEERLGVKLLNRTTRKLSLTDAGQSYFEKASAIIEQAEEAEAEITTFQAAPKGRLRVTAPIAFGNMELRHILPSFMEAYPDLEVEMYLTDQKIDLMESNFDLAIRIGTLKDSSLIARKLGTTYGVIIASPEYWKKHGRPKVPSDLLNHNCMRYSNAENPGLWRFTSPEGKQENIKVSGKFLSNNGRMEVLMAEKGNGVCRVPSFLCEDKLASGTVEPVLEEYEMSGFGIYAVYMPARYTPTKIRAFIDHIVKHRTSEKGKGVRK
ncbi:LysR family transcriptional regulator [Curvivirga aplysinae]|uniref:LysR family transcriptional regulator n=1 Tax=Curvivirga aplysinae TaxID=2529852 RepID=UPI001C3F6B68|nr:LysR family transcriptional regulator [Curvivirga aplysinae]